ncbi:Telomerase reverse transcriptase [Kalmusia sp. IMI 367209]|nr:Telomerase reverse transcriptase [Kalmusia sp. IMI 367209]
MKRKRNTHAGGRNPKRVRAVSDQSPVATTASVEHPVLSRLYPEVLSLRHYLLSRLPASSRLKSRRRKLSQLGLHPSHEDTATCGTDLELGELLDSTLVGVLPNGDADRRENALREREKDLESFTQELSLTNSASTFKPGYFLQSEIVDFVVWRLFKRSSSYKPSHLLCHGFQRSGAQSQTEQQKTAHCIPGLSSIYRNTAVETLKGPLWCRLHAILGKTGRLIMMDMLIESGIFSPVEGSPGDGNLLQLSGIPLSELKPAHVPISVPSIVPMNYVTTKKPNSLVSENRKPNAITFVRTRMMYARAALNAKGGVRFGMRHIHILNRFPDLEDDQQTVHIMRHIFPRQYGLHNVFTSIVDKRETAMAFKDYTLREKEIHQAMCRELPEGKRTEELVVRWKRRVPRRLRGDTVTLVDKLRKLNERCSVYDCLNVGSAISKPRTVEDTCFTDMACPTAHVSAFCRAAIAKVIPNALWGTDDNKRIIMYWIDQFVFLRRFESLTLHQVTENIQISTLAWLRPPGLENAASMAKSDHDKRHEIFLEFVYWVFDSFLIPLIRSNFHVTESNVHRNRLFYFRHDVWRMLTEPSLSNLRINLFEEVSTDHAAKLLSLRPLGFSKIRLLPKRLGVRLITNLKRRQQVMRNGTMVLGRSINSVMTPAFNVITYERSLHPEKFGSSLFSVGDMFPKLSAFKQSLNKQGLGDSPLYFAKVDVQSCFDTIPQQRLLTMVESLLSMQEYHTGKHVEVRALGQLQRLDGQYVNPMPLKRYVAHSGAADNIVPFDRLVQDNYVGSKANTVFVPTAAQKFEAKDDLMQLLREHVERNLVKIGKRFYRQKSGIPQGSVLSTILCNFFYAELERDVLSFALGSDCLLLRLLDDFCLITTDRKHAERFVQVMHHGHADYGVVVKATKSLANFDVATTEGNRMPRCVSGVRFPYCGVQIDMRTLEVSKTNERTGPANITDSLTVDLAKVPGQTFHRKALNSPILERVDEPDYGNQGLRDANLDSGFKIQLQAMLIDTSFNSVPTVLANLYQSFHEAARRSMG